jgi:hypothetical protein
MREGRREKGEGRREKGEGRREKGEWGERRYGDHGKHFVEEKVLGGEKKKK